MMQELVQVAYTMYSSTPRSRLVKSMSQLIHPFLLDQQVTRMNQWYGHRVEPVPLCKRKTPAWLYYTQPVTRQENVDRMFTPDADTRTRTSFDFTLNNISHVFSSIRLAQYTFSVAITCCRKSKRLD